MSKIQVEHIFMNYHSVKSETKAINDISFSVDNGQFLSIVGPSGCGKSTLLNIIAGLIKPSGGQIYVDGDKLDNFTSKIGYMFQKDHLFEWLTVWENVCLGLKIKHKLTKENEGRVKNLLENYNLQEFINYHPKELSGGMRQRVALIRTLALDPEALLLDEPFSALDYQSRLKVSDEIAGIIKKENKTAIMVTHDISEAIAMSQRVIVLSKRPAYIKKDIQIDFENDNASSIEKRENAKFRGYFNAIWKELDLND